MQFMRVFRREATEDGDVVTGMVGARVAGIHTAEDRRRTVTVSGAAALRASKLTFIGEPRVPPPRRGGRFAV
jgi:hypothetical protein